MSLANAIDNAISAIETAISTLLDLANGVVSNPTDLFYDVSVIGADVSAVKNAIENTVANVASEKPKL